MKCQLCNEEFEEEPLSQLSLIVASKHYRPTFFVKFSVQSKDGHVFEKAKLCKRCMEELYKLLGNEFKEE